MKLSNSVLLLLLVVAACAAPATPRPAATPFSGTRRAVIIDTDMAPDDWRAILFLLRRQDVVVRAITVVGTGEAHCGPGMRNALGLAALAGQPNIPVACGRETALASGHPFPDEWRATADAALGLRLPANPGNPAPSTALVLIQSLVAAAPGQVTMLTLGPLTNLADALQATPELASQMEMLVIMGGAVNVPGNNPAASAEWNFYADPGAAASVLRSGAPLTLVPLDATNHVPVTQSFYNRLKADHATPVGQFIYDGLTEEKSLIDTPGYEFWDSLTAAIWVDESLSTFQSRALAAEPETGRVVEQAGGPLVRFAVTADKERFEQAFLDGVNAIWP